MATSAGAFCVGVATTFAILGVGFGGGLMMAKSALQEPTSRPQASFETERPPVRVILPASNESAQPPQLPGGTAAGPSAQEEQPVKEINQPIGRQVEKADSKRAEAKERERKQRYVERKARRQVEARARQQQRGQQQPREQTSAPVMAFGGDDPPRPGGSLFGN